jgi:hypothetical protein
MKLKKSFNFLTIFAFFLLTTFVLAQTNETLAPTFTALKCKIEFNIDVLKLMSVNSSAGDLPQNIINLQADMAQLNNLIAQGNKTAIKDFVSTNLDKDIKMSCETAKDWTKANWKNFTKAQRQELKESYGQYKQRLDNCHLSAMREIAYRKIAEYNKHLSHYQNITNMLASKGIDVSSLQRILSEATAQIIMPLQTDVSKAATEKEIKDALKKYCLFNGCKNGINYHLAARFEVAKLDLTINHLKSRPNLASSAEKLNTAQAKVEVAKNILNSIKTGVYNDEEVWVNIDSAYKLIKELQGAYKK